MGRRWEREEIHVDVGGDMYRVVDVSYESFSCDTIETYNAQSNDILVSDTKQRSYIDMISDTKQHIAHHLRGRLQTILEKLTSF